MLSSNTSAVSGDAKYIEDYFSSYLYTGTSATQNIVNGLDLATKGGMVWTAARAVADNKRIWDTARGANKDISTNSTAAQSTRTNAVTSFNTDGFSLGSDGAGIVNATGSGAYVSWSFAKATKFFDVVTYTGNGTARTIAHNLGSVPGCIITKCTSSANNWYTYHRSTGNTNELRLNTTAAAASGSLWNSTDPTSTVFSLGASSDVNSSGETYVAYLFAHDAGGFGLTGTDNVISCGSYTGNGSASGPEINLGYEPQFVIYKCADVAYNWYMVDVMRGMPVADVGTALIKPNAAEAEFNLGAGYTMIAPTATGFKVTSTDLAVNASGKKFIYIAIRRGPMKVPTDGTKVFSPVTRAGTSATATITSGFVTDTVWAINRAGTTRKGYFDRLRGNLLFLDSSDTDGEKSAAGSLTSFGSNTGVTVGNESGGWNVINGTGINYVNWCFQRAPSFFDEVCYTGTGSATAFNHNLGVKPELIIIKKRSGVSNWFTGYNFTSTTVDEILLDTTAAAATYNYNDWFGAQPTATTFTPYVNTSTNASTYVAYLFATCAGVSKVGSYTGTGTTKQVDCGFAAGARFVLIKRTDSTGDWYVWDTARGIVSGNDPYLLLNSTAAEVTTTDYIDTYSAGFELSSTAPAALNASGGTYIFLAIA